VSDYILDSLLKYSLNSN